MKNKKKMNLVFSKELIGFDFKLFDINKIEQYDHLKLPIITIKETSLSRKKRINFFNKVKNDFEVNIIVDFSSVDFEKFEFPRVGLDCHSFELSGVKLFNEKVQSIFTTKDFISFVNKTSLINIEGLLEEHDSPFHKESINTHIDICLENSLLTKNEYLIKIALWHDIGKAFTKRFDEKSGFYRFKNHEKFSACLFLNYIYSIGEVNDENIFLCEIILQHMNGHSIEKVPCYLNEKEKLLLSEFVLIDDKSRIV